MDITDRGAYESPDSYVQRKCIEAYGENYSTRKTKDRKAEGNQKAFEVCKKAFGQLIDDKISALKMPNPNPKISMEFVECPECAKKPGSPILCPSCLNNRAVIEALKKERSE